MQAKNTNFLVILKIAPCHIYMTIYVHTYMYYFKGVTVGISGNCQIIVENPSTL